MDTEELKVIYAVMKKELKIYFRYPVWVLFDAFMPIIWMLSIVIYSKALVGSQISVNLMKLTYTGDYVAYAVIGSFVSGFMFTTMWGIGYALRGEQWSGTLESTFLAPSSRISILIGKALSSMLTTSLWILLQLIISIFIFGLRIQLFNLPIAMLVLLVSLPSFFGIGFALAGITLDLKEPDPLINFLSSVFRIVLPIAYPIAILPTPLKEISYLLPFTYSIEGMRIALLQTNFHTSLLQTSFLLVILDLIWLPFGIIVYFIEERRVMKNGTLSYY